MSRILWCCMLVGIDLGVFRLGGETDNHTAHVPGHKQIDRQRKLQLDTIYFSVGVKNLMVLV